MTNDAIKAIFVYIYTKAMWLKYGHDLSSNNTVYADTDLLESIHGTMSRLLSLKQNISCDVLESVGLGIFNDLYQNLCHLRDNVDEELFNILIDEALNMNFTDFDRKSKQRTEKIKELKYDYIVNKIRNVAMECVEKIRNHNYNTRSTSQPPPSKRAKR